MVFPTWPFFFVPRVFLHSMPTMYVCHYNYLLPLVYVHTLHCLQHIHYVANNMYTVHVTWTLWSDLILLCYKLCSTSMHIGYT